jgi:predicted dehydrogenase
VAFERGEPMDRSIARFVAALSQHDRSLVACHPEEARDTLAVALACERALESGERVAVSR